VILPFSGDFMATKTSTLLRAKSILLDRYAALKEDSVLAARHWSRPDSGPKRAKRAKRYWQPATGSLGYLWSLGLVCLTAAACGSNASSPTAPSTIIVDVIADPGSDGPAGLEVEVTPNPVPWSRTPDSESTCGDVLNTWFYTQVLRNTGGSTIVVTDRADYFNNREVSRRSNVGITLEPGAETRITTRWCSVSSVVQTAQTDWGATDTSTAAGLTVVGPRVTLQAK
jgi:hypothetical protein